LQNNNATIGVFSLSTFKTCMKNSIIIICLLSALFTNGQKHSISINYKPSLTYFGKQRQSFDNSYFTSRNGNNTFNNIVNILYSCRVLTKISLTTGVEYAEQGQHINFIIDRGTQSSNVIYKAALNYLRIPITIGYAVLKNNTSELNIYSGISLGIATKRNDNYQDIILLNILLPPPYTRYENKDWAIPIGINYQKGLTKRIFAIFGTEYLVGLTNSFTNNGASEYDALSQFDHSKQNRLSVTIGIGINLSNRL
jgi:hypothetical protein